MTDREKLMKLVLESIQKSGWVTPPELVDHLLVHGVTVKEPQKPLKLEEATGTNNIVWYERKFGQYRVIPCDAVFSQIAGFVELAIIGHEKPMYCPANSYGKAWRCWAEKPTEEERMAAEWLT